MDVRQGIFPYGMEKQKSGKWVFFNRNYKPVGFNTSEWIDYDKFPVEFDLKGLTSAKRKKLCIDGDGTKDTIYFYKDGSVPNRSAENLSDYFERLEIIIKLTNVR